jgi:uncharacterized protein YndB with AHSA1/START domain
VRRVTARVHRTLADPPERVFETLVPIDLSTIIQRWGPFPGVTGVRDQTGGWDHVGASRTVMLEDGSSAREELTAFNPPHHFGYTLTFGAPTSLLASEAAGTWWMRPARDGGTELEWAWAFAPRPGAGPLIELVVGPMWRRYAQQALERYAAQADGSPRQ